MKFLTEAIEDVYRAFADVPTPKSIPRRLFYTSQIDFNLLLSVNPRALSANDLSPYALSASHPKGPVEEYLYFLPRILELAAHDAEWWPSPEIIGKTVSFTQPHTWPAPRLKALKKFLDTVVELAVQKASHFLQDPLRDGRAIDSWLCGIAHMELDVRPYLQEVERFEATVVAYHAENSYTIAHKKRLGNKFWELPCPGHDVIFEWFASEKIREIVSRVVVG